MPVVNTAEFWLTTGAHAEPTDSLVPNQGDWSWCMMEAAAWMADETWSDTPACVSPVIADVCKTFNDGLSDPDRQTILVPFLAAAPAGVIDTVDAGKETDRKLMCTDWLIRTFLPLVLTAAGLTDDAADLAALPAIATGTLDADETIAVLAGVGMNARAAGEFAWSDLDWASLPGDGRPDYPVTGEYFPFLWPTLEADLPGGLDLAARFARNLGVNEDGSDDGQAAWDRARGQARAAAWDFASLFRPLPWDSTRANPTPWLGVTGGTDADADTVGLAAWQAVFDAVLVAVTNGRLARETYDAWEVRFASWLAWVGADLSENAAAVAYAAALDACSVNFAAVGADINTSISTLLGDLCAL